MGKTQEKKIAYNRLHLDDGSVVMGPVVVSYDIDTRDATEWHLLSGEEPFVIWNGGDGTLHI